MVLSGSSFIQQAVRALPELAETRALHISHSNLPTHANMETVGTSARKKMLIFLWLQPGQLISMANPLANSGNQNKMADIFACKIQHINKQWRF